MLHLGMNVTSWHCVRLELCCVSVGDECCKLALRQAGTLLCFGWGRMLLAGTASGWNFALFRLGKNAARWHASGGRKSLRDDIDF